MTNEEAIEFIKTDISRLWNTPQNLEHKEALEIAIKALSEQRIGHWIRIAGGSFIDDYRCDCCNQRPPVKKVDLTWGWDFTDYCPSCGAKMEKEG